MLYVWKVLHARVVNRIWESSVNSQHLKPWDDRRLPGEWKEDWALGISMFREVGKVRNWPRSLRRSGMHDRRKINSVWCPRETWWKHVVFEISGSGSGNGIQHTRGECGLRSKDGLLNLTRGKSMWELADLVRRVCGSWSAAFFSVK